MSWTSEGIFTSKAHYSAIILLTLYIVECPSSIVWNGKPRLWYYNVHLPLLKFMRCMGNCNGLLLLYTSATSVHSVYLKHITRKRKRGEREMTEGQRERFSQFVITKCKLWKAFLSFIWYCVIKVSINIRLLNKDDTNEYDMGYIVSKSEFNFSLFVQISKYLERVKTF